MSKFKIGDYVSVEKYNIKIDNRLGIIIEKFEFNSGIFYKIEYKDIESWFVPEYLIKNKNHLKSFK